MSFIKFMLYKSISVKKICKNNTVPRKYLIHQYEIIILLNCSGCISLITCPIFNFKAFLETLNLKLSTATTKSIFWRTDTHKSELNWSLSSLLPNLTDRLQAKNSCGTCMATCDKNHYRQKCVNKQREDEGVSLLLLINLAKRNYRNRSRWANNPVCLRIPHNDLTLYCIQERVETSIRAYHIL